MRYRPLDALFTSDIHSLTHVDLALTCTPFSDGKFMVAFTVQNPHTGEDILEGREEAIPDLLSPGETITLSVRVPFRLEISS